MGSEGQWAQCVNHALHLRIRAIDSSCNAIIIADLTRPGFPIEYVNWAFERITGYNASETLERNADFLVGEYVDRPDLRELEWRCASDAKPAS